MLLFIGPGTLLFYVMILDLSNGSRILCSAVSLIRRWGFDLPPGIALSFLEHLLAVRHLVQRPVPLRAWTRSSSQEKVILSQEPGPTDDA